jgi:hypothetical protein
VALGDRTTQKPFHSRTDFNHTKYLQYQNYVTYMWHVHMEEGRCMHRVLVGNPEGKRPLGRPRHRWVDNIKMDLQDVGGGCGDWMELAQDRDSWRALVNTVMNLRVPKMRGIS